MKKIIILAIATLSTGIVLSSSLKKGEATSAPKVEAQKSAQADKATPAPSCNLVAQGD